jgi:hypothetical protein
MATPAKCLDLPLGFWFNNDPRLAINQFSIIERAPAAIERAPPAIEQMPPAIEQMPPAIERAPPAIEQMPPAIEQMPPAIEQMPPAIERAPRAERFEFMALNPFGNAPMPQHHREFTPQFLQAIGFEWATPRAPPRAPANKVYRRRVAD